jgi:hypothetical protein
MTDGIAAHPVRQGHPRQLSPQNDNVLFAQSRNVLLTPFRLGRWQKDKY